MSCNRFPGFESLSLRHVFFNISPIPLFCQSRANKNLQTPYQIYISQQHILSPNNSHHQLSLVLKPNNPTPSVVEMWWKKCGTVPSEQSERVDCPHFFRILHPHPMCHPEILHSRNFAKRNIRDPHKKRTPRMKGYQFLENDFFALCQTREIGKTPMLLYIYLRGLYCRFQKPVFFWQDKTIRAHLSISQSTLSRSRAFLQKRGVIKFHSGKGTHPTEYTMLGTVLLPVVKKTTPPRQNDAYYRHFDDPLYASKERLKKENNGVTREQGEQWGQISTFNKNADIKEFEKMLKVEI